MKREDLISDAYKNQNLLLHETNRFGRRGDRWADKVRELMASDAVAGVLDYGCGQGALRQALDLDIAEYDPAIPGKDRLPSPADLVVCTDVLEHIEPDLLQNVLAHLHSLTRKLLLATISTRPAVKTLPDGRNAHLIVESPDVWRQWLSPYFDIREWTVFEDEVIALLQPKADS